MMNRLRSSVALTVLLAACTKPPAPPPAADSYPITQPTRGAVDERTFVGQVQASRYVELRARHKGLVERWAVDEGQPVKASRRRAPRSRAPRRSSRRRASSSRTRACCSTTG
jgi:multidrug efflux pump subunit AcrA (membrane-fusion protein)